MQKCLLQISNNDNKSNNNNNQNGLQKEQHGKERNLDSKKKLVNKIKIEISFIGGYKHYTEKS